jgi:caa(3)-type oxidase subunit IV
MNARVASSKSTVWTWVILIALLALTWGASQFDLQPFNAAIALLIAGIKVVVVILCFMRVRLSGPVERLFVVAGFVWLALLFGLMFSDYLTRAAFGG